MPSWLRTRAGPSAVICTFYSGVQSLLGFWLLLGSAGMAPRQLQDRF
jgi:hypothetical protein